MTEKQKYAIKLAIDTMDKHFGRHCNTVYGNRKTGVTVGYGEAINILSDMVTDNDSKQTNADKIRNMSDDELATNMMCPNENGLAEIDCDKNDNCNCYECLLKWLQSEVE